MKRTTFLKIHPHTFPPSPSQPSRPLLKKHQRSEVDRGDWHHHHRQTHQLCERTCCRKSDVYVGGGLGLWASGDMVKAGRHCGDIVSQDEFTNAMVVVATRLLRTLPEGCFPDPLSRLGVIRRICCWKFLRDACLPHADRAHRVCDMPAMS